MTRTILLADDHVIIRRGLKTLLDTNFGRSNWMEVDRTSDVLEALKNSAITHAVLDVQLLDANILELIADIRKKYPQLPIMLYTMCSEDIYAPRMYKLGINAFLSKQCSENQLIAAFNRFFQHKSYYSQEVLNAVAAEEKLPDNPLQQLSEREFMVLQYLVQGLTVKEICNQLDLKTTTVATYKARIFEKTGAENVVDLVRLMDVYAHAK
jgi:DNA-binding NarL/FixJ family response regulator